MVARQWLPRTPHRPRGQNACAPLIAECTGSRSGRSLTQRSQSRRMEVSETKRASRWKRSTCRLSQSQEKVTSSTGKIRSRCVAVATSIGHLNQDTADVVPMDSSFVSAPSLNGPARYESLNEALLAEARVALGTWRADYTTICDLTRSSDGRRRRSFAFTCNPRWDLALCHADGSALTPVAITAQSGKSTTPARRTQD
ncbi:hypothetical protein FBZ94_1106 [Bradyrhizobium sacchari]|uniref:Uncharacterized protein n=1 Tax=Bradyrhizobium sacchari TaxID=1399419 RepID=A0A560HWZ1_9BRAD|nr:hypothetical protein FBZ94_1106 [Bradyrhizobium sacchari]TWB69410.1 hypothetical protein FBZ95_1096 [Bradyrhizobium sacchari]